MFLPKAIWRKPKHFVQLTMLFIADEVQTGIVLIISYCVFLY
jgi:hypothetical protein